MTFCLGLNGLLMTIQDFKNETLKRQVLYYCIETMKFCIISEACFEGDELKLITAL